MPKLNPTIVRNGLIIVGAAVGSLIAGGFAIAKANVETPPDTDAPAEPPVES